MPAGGSLSKRRAFYIVAIVVALSLTIVAVRDRLWHRATLPAVTWTTSTTARRDFVETPGFSEQLRTMRDLRALSPAHLEGMYFSIVEQQQIRCPSSARIGKTQDGGWDVCFTDPFDIGKSQPCVALSFGINHIWDYDDQLADQYHCKVHMFDPSMSGVTDHQRRNTSWFYLTGLASTNKLASNGWKMRTLCQLFKDLGYSEKLIDILKVDIEFWEWESFEQALKDGCLKRVKQLLFETHAAEFQGKVSDYARFIRVWLGLFDLGFRTWKWHRNPQSVFYRSAGGAQRACCYEHYMLNTNLL